MEASQLYQNPAWAEAKRNQFSLRSRMLHPETSGIFARWAAERFNVGGASQQAWLKVF